MNHISYADLDNENSISIELPKISSGDTTTVKYTGVLNNSGAEKVYLHYGFDNWKDTHTVPMTKTHTGTYKAEVKVHAKNEMNFCFKDSANNWDNNNGNNWTVDVR